MELKVKYRQPNSKMCFVCGYENNMGLKSSFYIMEDESLVAVFSPLDEHQSYPGRMHGGISATILDEAIGRSVNLDANSDVWGVTVDFSIRYKKPVPLDTRLMAVCRITKETKRTFEGKGYIVLEDGTVAAEASGKYMKMSIDKIADMDVEGGEWVTIDEDDPVTCLTVPDELLSIN